MPTIRPPKQVDNWIGQVKVEVSLASEFIMSMRLCFQNHLLKYEDMVGKWRLKVRRQMVPQTIETLEQISFIVPMSIVLRLPLPRTANDLLELLQAMPAETFLDELLAAHNFDTSINSIIQKIRQSITLTPEEYLSFQELFGEAAEADLVIKYIPRWTDSPQLKKRLLEALTDFNNAFFQREIERLRPILETSASQARTLLEIQLLPTTQLIEGLTHGFILDRSKIYRYIILSPSFYGSPYIDIEYLLDGGVLLLYPARPADMTIEGAYTANEQLLQRLKALADKTRLEILQLLAKRSYFTQELADTLKLSQPTISHHMAELRVAGLVRVEVHNNTKQYSLYPGFIDQLAQELGHLLEKPS